MAQPGDTITYTFSGAKETEDISNIDKIVIDRMDGADSGSIPDAATDYTSSGGLIQDATVDVSSYDVLEIWVGRKGKDPSITNNGGFGRSNGGDGGEGDMGAGGGSTELVAKNTSTGETAFIAAVDAGGGGTSTIRIVEPI